MPESGILTSDNRELSEVILPAQSQRPEMVGLPPDVADYVFAALAENTQRAYESDLRHFQAWGGSVPASARTVAQYLAHHAGRLSVATLTRRLVAIGKAHSVHGVTSPTKSDLVRLTMRGIRRRHGRPQRRVAAAVREDILAMVAGLGDTLREHRDRALLLIGFAGAFRRSELVAIDCTDIERVAQGVIITVRRSKTDQVGRGRRVAIPFSRTGTCPIAALDAWLSAAGIKRGPVFRPVNRHGRVSTNALSGEAVAMIVKNRARAVGLDPSPYSGHSLRAGFATSAAIAGAATWRIREQTGHASDAMLQRYIRDASLHVSNGMIDVL
jgi:integrase